ncbi:hypothetical protein ACUUL3_11820 [Thiovibrio sp. JS02]
MLNINEEIEFGIHTSPEMVSLFKRKPFQGQSPEKAKIIFLSSDANYSPEISNHDFFKYILEYQKDGVAFWNKYGCHHPFLLANYPFSKSKAGVPFHRNFSKLGFGPEHASHISFVELLDVPTIGNKSENVHRFYSLVSKSHLEYLETLMLGGGNKLFLVSSGVLRNMNKLKKIHSVFQDFQFECRDNKLFLKFMCGNRIQEISHFSSSKIHGEIDTISRNMREWLSNH